MNLRLLLPLFAAMGLCHAADTVPPLQPQPLATVKGSIALPQGWFVNESTEDGVTVYQISREKVSSQTDTFVAGLILTVTPKVPDRAQLKPSEYAAELLSATIDDTSQLKKTTDGPWQIFRSQYKIDADGGAINVFNLAMANDQTGTLYFVTWQSPGGEEESLAPVREAILGSLKFDPSF